jgi:hypothetical protein
MKKILSLLIACMMLLSVGFAQTKKAPKKAQQTTAVQVKKDGTPDKRYKANKAKAAPVVVLKKDGTPDKRYKAKPAKKS